MRDETAFDPVAEVRLRMSYNDSALFAADYLADLVRRSEPESGKAALLEALRYQHRMLRSEGAWEFLRVVPPMMLPGWMNPQVLAASQPNTMAVMDLLFPRPEGEPPRRMRPDNFFTWQASLVQRAMAGVRPTRTVARAKWLERCRNDSAWSEAANTLAGVAAVYVRRGSNRRLSKRWGHDPLASRLAKAMLGEVKCRHTSTIPSCRGCSSQGKAVAAHLGWRPRTVAATPNVIGDACVCCEREHDWWGRKEPKCLYCAEASLNAGTECLARRWGGWFWLQRELLNDAWAENHLALASEGKQVRGKLGYYPFSHDLELEAGRRQSGAFLIPVPWFEDDSKQQLTARARAVIDAMWELGGVSHARSTGASAKRSTQLERRLEWLWRHRVSGDSFKTIADSGDFNPDGVEERQIRRAVRQAIEELMD